MTEQDRTGEITLTGGGGTPHRQAEASPEVGLLHLYVEGNLARTIPLNVPVITIGRTPANSLPLPHKLVSRAHAELRVGPEGVIVTDVGSANGTFVNDVQLAPHQPVQLAHGSIIRIGPFILRYEASGATAPSAETLPGQEGESEEEPAGGVVVPHLVPRAVHEPVAYIPPPPAVYVPAAPSRPTHRMPLPADPVSSYLDFLPVIFQDGDFLGRFLLIFQSIWEPLEYRQDHMDMYFDPRTCPTPFLRWLADWLGVVLGSVSEEGRLRELLGEAVELYRWRGTLYGLTRLIEICTGVTPVIVETPQNPAVLHIRVALPAESNLDRDAIERFVRDHKPAHTAYLLEVFS